MGYCTNTDTSTTNIIELIDSTGLIPNVHYVFVYAKITEFKHIERNK